MESSATLLTSEIACWAATIQGRSVLDLNGGRVIEPMNHTPGAQKQEVSRDDGCAADAPCRLCITVLADLQVSGTAVPSTTEPDSHQPFGQQEQPVPVLQITRPT